MVYRPWIWSLVPRSLTALLVLVVAAGGPGGLTTNVSSSSSATHARTTSRAPGGCVRAVQFDEADFPVRPEIDNRWLPLVPGRQLVLQGTSRVTGQSTDHEVTFTVTDLTKMIGDVNSVVVYDVDRSAGQVTEAELAFFAQDEDGNVWNLGEYPEEYGDAGEFLGAPNTWIAGKRRAEAGIHMLASPEVTDTRYLQGWSPTIDFLDCANVVATDETATVPAGSFTDVLVTDETSPLEPDSGSQRKHHVPGVGIVRVDAIDDPEGEVLDLAEINVLSPAQLATVRKQALELDEHAYEVSDVYRGTGPAIATVPDPDPADEADDADDEAAEHADEGDEGDDADEADEADDVRLEGARHLSHWLAELLDADRDWAAARTTHPGARARLLLSRRR